MDSNQLYLLGIDLGTSATKTVLFNEKGEKIASDSYEYPLSQPHNGWAEQDPEDWYTAAVETLKNVVLKAKEQGVAPEHIAGIGVSGQMHGLIMLDDKNQVIRPAILWCDQRTGKECEELADLVGYNKIIEISANRVSTGFTASKILWVKNNEPENFKKCKKILLPKDYLNFRLSGVFSAEMSDASGTQLLDVKNRRWAETMVNALDISMGMLPELHESPDVIGHISADICEKTGLTPNTLLVAGAGDNAAAAVGMGVVEDGKAFTTIGTSGVVFTHTSTPHIDPEARVHTLCCAVPGEWNVMGVTQGAGLSLSWFKSEFCHKETEEAEKTGKHVYGIIDEEAATVPIGSDKLLYLPYLMGERTPYFDPDCRGVFFGISAMHTRAHFLRAVMEGVTYSLYDSIQILKEMDVCPTEMLACGGGSVSSLWRTMLADVFAMPVKTQVTEQGPALGVAVLAAVGAGIYDTVPEACKHMTHIKKEQISPNAEHTGEYRKYQTIYTKLYADLKETFKQTQLLK